MADRRAGFLKLEVQDGVVFMALSKNYGVDLEELGEVSALV